MRTLLLTILISFNLQAQIDLQFFVVEGKGLDGEFAQKVEAALNRTQSSAKLYHSPDKAKDKWGNFNVIMRVFKSLESPRFDLTSFHVAFYPYSKNAVCGGNCFSYADFKITYAIDYRSEFYYRGFLDFTHIGNHLYLYTPRKQDFLNKMKRGDRIRCEVFVKLDRFIDRYNTLKTQAVYCE
jgi:hypothetical protein